MTLLLVGFPELEWFVGDREGHRNFLIGNGLRGQSTMISARFTGPGGLMCLYEVVLRTIYILAFSNIRWVILRLVLGCLHVFADLQN